MSPERVQVRKCHFCVGAVRLLLLALVVSVSAAHSFPWPAAPDDTERDAWQRPEQVMDALGIRPGSRVADVGCGEGYFVSRVSRRLGPEGRVYAVDTDEGALRKLRRRLEEEGLANVEVIRGKPDDPLLPDASLDAVLIVNAYHEMREHDAMLRRIYAALKPGGRLAIIDPAGGPEATRGGLHDAHASSEKLVREDAWRAGFRFRGQEPGFERPGARRRHWFFLIFEKPAE